MNETLDIQTVDATPDAENSQMELIAKARGVLSYDPDTGVFRWKEYMNRSAPAGQVAGSTDDLGYIRMSLLGKRFRAHQMAYAFMTGKWPPGQIDHIDGNRANNRYANLRLASQSLNSQNLRSAKSSSHSGVLGVQRHGSSWRATLQVGSRHYRSGGHPSPEAAYAAYVDLKREFHTGGVL